MIRRDYILRMIEEFMQALSRIRALQKGQRSQEAAVALDEEFNRLVGGGSEALAGLTETELLAKLIKGEPTQVVHAKTLMLTTLLKEAGDLAAAQDRTDGSRSCYLKGLHLLLHTLAGGDPGESPDFVPKIEMFVAALQGAPLPLETNAMLMQHYERSGQFAKAEDALFAMLEAEPQNTRILEFGIAFYQRLEGLSDASLDAGDLPRSEVEAGLAELHDRKTALSV
jgi:hypothetical protein